MFVVVPPTVTTTSTAPAAYTGAVTVICVPVALTVIADVTGVPPKDTAVGPVNPAPLMVIAVPPRWLPEAGLTAVMTRPSGELPAARNVRAPARPRDDDVHRRLGCAARHRHEAEPRTGRRNDPQRPHPGPVLNRSSKRWALPVNDGK